MTRGNGEFATGQLGYGVVIDARVWTLHVSDVEILHEDGDSTFVVRVRWIWDKHGCQSGLGAGFGHLGMSRKQRSQLLGSVPLAGDLNLLRSWRPGLDCAARRGRRHVVFGGLAVDLPEFCSLRCCAAVVTEDGGLDLRAQR